MESKMYLVNRELTEKYPIGDEMHNWAFQIGVWGFVIGDWILGNRLELVGIDWNRLVEDGIGWNMWNWAYLIIFQHFPSYSFLFQPMSAYFNLFQSIPAYSNLLQPIPAYSSLFQPNQAHSSLLQPVKSNFSCSSLFPNPQSPIPNPPSLIWNAQLCILSHIGHFVF